MITIIDKINKEIETSFINNRYPDSEFENLNLSELIDTSNFPFDYIPYMLISKNILLNLIKSDLEFTESIYSFKNDNSIFKYQMLIIKHYNHLSIDEIYKTYLKSINVNSELLKIYQKITNYNKNLDLTNSILLTIENKIDEYIKSNIESNSGIDKSIAKIAEVHLLYILKTNNEIFEYLNENVIDDVINKTFINQYNIIDKFIFGSF